MGTRTIVGWASCSVALACCTQAVDLTEAPAGHPLPELTERELSAFAAGQALFNQPFGPEQGLGPLFNQDRCSSCHDLPTSGGHGAEPVTKATRFTPAEGCSTLGEHGGDLLQQVATAAARSAGLGPELIPAQATAAADIRPPAIYGLGLVESLAADDILALADPEDEDVDGISGRPNLDGVGRVGRFGRKAQHVSLAAFIEEATRLEMGLTTPEHPEEEPAAGVAVPEAADPAADPEVGAPFLAALVDYVRFLAPPERAWPPDPSGRGDIEEGERIFEFAGCPACHVPTFTTAAVETAALSRRTFRLYSDLLLHDMGPELADICAPGTLPSEWKTARLVGLSHRSEFLHDGRAQRIDDAIELHGGEAAASRDVFRRLNPTARAQLLRFLDSL